MTENSDELYCIGCGAKYRPLIRKNPDLCRSLHWKNGLTMKIFIANVASD